eukprot:6195233-Pleurochrysis_carterae.AAC.4
MWSRSRTGGGPPSGESAEEKKRETEKVEQVGDATTAMYSPAAQRCRLAGVLLGRRELSLAPPCAGSESMQSVTKSRRERKAARPSGLDGGPENRNRTFRDWCARASSVRMVGGARRSDGGR